jgi:hypothetical protein
MRPSSTRGVPKAFPRAIQPGRRRAGVQGALVALVDLLINTKHQTASDDDEQVQERETAGLQEQQSRQKVTHAAPD